MSIARLQILALLYFFFFLHHHQLLTLALDFPTPSPVHNNLAATTSIPKPRKFCLPFDRVNTIATAVIIFITLLNVLVYKLLQLQELNSDDKLSVSSSLPSERQLCRRFSLAEILSATNKFDESFVIGRGGFGKVYKGVVDNGATTVAIKRLNSMSKQGAPEFWTEIEMLSKFRHSHLVALIGYCDIFNEMILVYEYMVHGTVADHLNKISRNGGDKSPLSWVQRLKICIGAAHGLDYLHTGTGVKHRVIHRDVKSSNILLDENWAAKISDFGLSKIGPADQSCTHISTNVKGTCGYMDPEYLLTRRLTRKSDVYSFGVVLFEVLCGRPAMDQRLHEDQRGLARWAKHCIKQGTVDQIIDTNLRGLILPSCLSTFVEIAGKCLHSRPKKRPTMTEVAGWLEFALALQERTDSSIVEKDIFNAHNEAYEIKEHTNSSMEREVINAVNSEHHNEKIGEIKQLDSENGGQSLPIKPAKRMTFAKKVRGFFSVRPRVVPVDKNRGAKSLQSDTGSANVAGKNFSNANKAGTETVEGKDSGGGSEVGGEQKEKAVDKNRAAKSLQFDIGSLNVAGKNFSNANKLGTATVEGKDSSEGREVGGEQKKESVDKNRGAKSLQSDTGSANVAGKNFSNANKAGTETVEGKDSGGGSEVGGEQKEKAVDKNRAAKSLQFDIGSLNVAGKNFSNANKLGTATVEGKDSSEGREVGGEQKKESGMTPGYSTAYRHNIKKESLLETLQPPIQIFVKNWNGKTITLYVHQKDTITDVTNKIFHKLGYSVDFLKLVYLDVHGLVFAGKLLQGVRDLASYGIEKDSTLHMILRPSTEVRPFKLSEVGGFPAGRNMSTTILHVKEMVENKLNIPVQEVLLRGLALRDEVDLTSCDIVEETELGIIF